MAAFVPNANKEEHRKLAAWFLGPKAENEEEFLDLIATALHGHSDWRKSYYPTVCTLSSFFPLKLSSLKKYISK